MQWPGGEKNPRAAILPLESDRSFFAKFSRFLPPAQWYNNNTGSNNEMSNSKEQWFLFFFGKNSARAWKFSDCFAILIDRDGFDV